MRDRFNKKGQFYLIAAIFIVMILFGTTSIATYATVKPEPRSITGVSAELNRETYNILEYGIINNILGTDLNDLLETFTGEDISKYFLKKSEDAKIVFVYGDKANIEVLSVGEEDTGSISIGGTNFGANNEFSKKAILVDSDGDGFVNVTILEKEYKFKIKNNQMFYFLIVKERGEEIFIERNKEDQSNNPNRPGGPPRDLILVGTPADLEIGKVSHWSFEGNFEDVKSDNDGSGIGNPGLVTGIVGQAVSFDGNDNIEVSDSSKWDLDGDGNNKDYSITLFFNANSFTTNWWEGAFISQDEGPGATNKWILSYDEPNSKFIFHLNGVSGEEHRSDIINVNNNQWYHLALVISGDDYEFYADGNPQGSGTLGDVPNVAAPLRIGYAEGPEKFNGLIDEVKIWDRSLSQSDIVGML